jgi:hypothetical protein
MLVCLYFQGQRGSVLLIWQFPSSLDFVPDAHTSKESLALERGEDLKTSGFYKAQ